MNKFIRIVQAVSTNQDLVEVWWCSSLVTYVSGTPYTLSIVPSTQSVNTYPVVQAYEVSGLTAVDAFIGGNTGGSTATSLTVTNSSANTGTQNFVMAVVALTAGSQTGLNTPLTTLDYNWIVTANNIAQFCHQTDTGSGATDSAAWTWTNASRAAGALVSFKSNASTLVQQTQLGYYNIAPSLLVPNVQMPMTTMPTSGNALIVAWAMGRNPSFAGNQVVSITDSMSFVTI